MAEGRRYQVFVSSTFLDLQEEREAVVSALLQMNAFPAGMELFPAADDDAWTLIQRVIDESDYYLLVIGGKYGSVDPETEISYTEKEYDYAVERGRPVMAFLHADPDKIEFAKSETDEAARAKLEAFRSKVKESKHVKHWSGPEDLAGKVALSFADFRQRYSAVGWIRGDAGTSAETLEEINDLRKRLTSAEASSEKVSHGPPENAKNFAQGDEEAEVVLQATARITTAYNLFEVTRDLDVRPSWDDLFYVIGPEMINEASDKALRKVLKRWLSEEFGTQVRQEIASETYGEGETVHKIRNLAIDVNGDDFGTLIVQFRALGLIEKSERQRSVKDTETYWALTPYGDEHLTTLRAIPRRENPFDAASAEKESAQPAPSRRAESAS
jgi:hypothetical protein